MTVQSISLLELNQRITRTLATTPGLTDVWVTGETSDLRVSGGHCYMELIQKENGAPVAKCRAVIWASTYARLAPKFAAATGSQLRSDMKIMVRVSVNYHAYYGFSLVINDINPEYTVGDLARKRMEIIARLQADGVYDLNRALPWSNVPWRIAIISARGAAGYGDFVKQLHNNALRLRFSTTLFEATLQGERTSPSVIAALDRIMECVDDFDCVVIIRGGGAVADLASFDDYDLAFNVAQFPLPVVVGIGHERDVTVLDYVANTRVKTPTAAAEFLIGLMSDTYGQLQAIGEDILHLVRDAIGGQRQLLAYRQGLLPALALNVVERNRAKVGPALTQSLKDAAVALVERRKQRLNALGELIEAISPEATLRRGYSITRINGHAITDSSKVKTGDQISTTFAKGPVINSTVD